MLPRTVIEFFLRSNYSFLGLYGVLRPELLEVADLATELPRRVLDSF